MDATHPTQLYAHSEDPNLLCTVHHLLSISQISCCNGQVLILQLRIMVLISENGEGQVRCAWFWGRAGEKQPDRIYQQNSPAWIPCSYFAP